jgi:tRNA(Arg) A34 adenosine deaminase TadA
MNRESFMRVALLEAEKGDLPYGAVLVKENQIVVMGHNTTQRENDVSAHAEMNVLRTFTKATKNYSPNVLKGYTLYATCEPCLMCSAACIWAGISEIVFGASTEELIELGVEQINLSCEAVIARGFQKIKVTKGILAQESLELFKK